MLSRTAESMFWIGRYLERAENLARVVDVAYHARLERVGGRRRTAADWEPLLAISGERERFFESQGAATARSVTSFLTFDTENPSSILGCLQRARDNANGMRDRITSEMWETLNTFYLWLSERSLLQETREGNLHALYAAVKERCHLFQGVAQATMVHDEGWQFLRVGKFLERASMTARILDIQYALLLGSPTAGSGLAPPVQTIQWIWLLRSVSAYEAYSKAFHQGIRPELVAEFLVFDPTFPRSIRYAVASAEASLKRVSDSPPGRYADAAERALGRLHGQVASGDTRELGDGRLHAFLREIQADCTEISDELTRIYFAYRVPGATLARS